MRSAARLVVAALVLPGCVVGNNAYLTHYPSPARGSRSALDGQATETVNTRDGSTYRGELVERVVGDHTTLQLATGEVKRIEARDIVALPETQSMEAAPQEAVSSPVLPPPPPPSSSSDTNRLHAPVMAVEGEGFAYGASSDTTRTTGVTSSRGSVGGMRDAFAWGSLGLGVALTAPALYLLCHHEPSTPYGRSGDRITGWVLLGNGLPWLIAGVALLASGHATVRSVDGVTFGSAPVDHGIALGGPFRLEASGITF